ncbi:cilia- and flagella-associated protein 36 [Cylas formicarius]|uniref:cilia- and flagella-associated protein 36 n=1 Tax=Cylas formicarius TaxID=197179 RepID=UPI002958B3DA|nr:cilia- and flagella-associated protein 36 [Cylas formicarius]
MTEEVSIDNSWVFDSLVCFLNGPIWNAPLQSFIEEKSLIFEPTDPNNVEYKNVFDEFKNLVDFMLGNFMDDIGITPEQFHGACLEGKKYHVSFDHNLFEQIWAANDYDMFVRMMTQKNVELQLQALELIEKKYGITPQSFIPTKSEERVQQIPVIIEQEPESEKEVIAEVAKKFPEEESQPSEIEIESLIEQKPLLEKKLFEAKEYQLNNTEANENTNTAQTTDNPVITMQEKTPEIDALELRKRQDYLRAQRDKLIALKKETRQKQLGQNSKSMNRPKSAKAAEAVLTGEKPNINSGQMQIRKTLAERLKHEVVDKIKKN